MESLIDLHNNRTTWDNFSAWNIPLYFYRVSRKKTFVDASKLARSDIQNLQEYYKGVPPFEKKKIIMLKID